MSNRRGTDDTELAPGCGIADAIDSDNDANHFFFLVGDDDKGSSPDSPRESWENWYKKLLKKKDVGWKLDGGNSWKQMIILSQKTNSLWGLIK